jgi:hypothetical protein
MTRHRYRTALSLLLPVACLATACLVAACKPDNAGAAAGDQANATSDSALPKPEPGAGSVTGMPDARSAGARRPDLAGTEDADAAPPPGSDASSDDGSDPDAVDLPPPPDGSEDPSVPPAMPSEPTAADAAGVLRSYYAAIDAGDFDRAYALWADHGRSSGQSEAQFEAGFDDTSDVSVQTGTPGRIEGAAGSRYIIVPASIRAVRDDGSVHRYEGTYTLRRAVVDGASAEQRAWRIDSADLREVDM